VAIAALAGLSVLIIILESTHLRSHQDDIHDSHPLLKEKLKPEDKCWTTENFEIIETCEVCTKEEIFGHKPLVCVALGDFLAMFSGNKYLISRKQRKSAL